MQRQFDVRALATELPRIERACAEVYDYVEALLDERRAAPADDLLSTLLAAEEEGDRLSHAECVNLVLNVLAGGVDTTQASSPRPAAVRRAPGPVGAAGRGPGAGGPAAYARCCRFEPITPFTARICVEPVELPRGGFPAGSIVAICAAQANREGAAGDRFDITAERDGRVLTFGAGAHYCLGANLATAELEEALTFLVPRMPASPPDGPACGGVEGICQVESLPLTWQRTPFTGDSLGSLLRRGEFWLLVGREYVASLVA